LYFVRSWNGNFRNITWPFEFFNDNSVLVFYSQFGMFYGYLAYLFPFWYVIPRNNLATMIYNVTS
jgi:hypothetical protein